MADDQAEVTTAGNGVMAHHLVSYRTMQVSVDNTGMLHLALIRPQDVPDLIVALQKAQEVGVEQQELNTAAQAEADAAAENAAKARAEAMSRHRKNAAASEDTEGSVPRKVRHVASERVDGGPDEDAPRPRKATPRRAAKRPPTTAAEEPAPVKKPATKRAPKRAPKAD